MSGCEEGILVDLSEPVYEEVNVRDSIELLRDGHCDRHDSEKFSSYQLLADSDQFMLDISAKSNISVEENTSADASPLRLIETETFDFDLPVTPGTNSDRSSIIPEDDDDEEEVFFGPVGFRERCAKSIVSSITKKSKPLSPLNQRQLAEIFKEANAVAVRISSSASVKKKKCVLRENLFCVKQLNLENSIFSKDAVGSLLLSVEKSCAKRENNRNCKENVNVLELAVDNGISDITGITANLDFKSSSSVSENESFSLPARQHSQLSTYTSDTSPMESLSDDNGKSCPVLTDDTSKFSTIQQDCSIEQGQKILDMLQQPASLEEKPQKAAISGSRVHKDSSSHTVLHQSKLAAPKSGSISFLPSKLRPVGSASSSTAALASIAAANVPVQPAEPVPQKTAIPGPICRGSLSVSKLHLLKPSCLQRPGSIQSNLSHSSKKLGPLKVFAPSSTMETIKDVSLSSAKQEFYETQTRSMSASFSTPSTKGSSSSMDSPFSSMTKKRSCLPTPNKLRTGSCQSIQSPCPSRARTSSTSSSRYMESPKLRSSESSDPGCTLKSKRQLGVNTPNHQRKNPLDPADKTVTSAKKLRR